MVLLRGRVGRRQNIVLNGFLLAKICDIISPLVTNIINMEGEFKKENLDVRFLTREEVEEAFQETGFKVTNYNTTLQDVYPFRIWADGPDDSGVSVMQHLDTGVIDLHLKKNGELFESGKDPFIGPKAYPKNLDELKSLLGRIAKGEFF